MLSASQALDREIALINSHKEDTIRVAAYSSIAMHWLPEVIQQFRRIHPELTVDIQMGSVEEVYRWVREDKADMGFASLQDGMTVDWLPWRRTRCWPSCRRSTTWAAGSGSTCGISAATSF